MGYQFFYDSSLRTFFFFKGNIHSLKTFKNDEYHHPTFCMPLLYLAYLVFDKHSFKKENK